MKKLFVIIALLGVGKITAQCTAFSSTASASIYSMTAVYNSSMGINVAICCNGILYDTLNNNNNMNYFIHQGGVLYKKGGVTTMVWLDGGAKIINNGGTSAIMAYSESTATITNNGMPAVNNNTCASVTIPFANCFPLGGPCGTNSLKEISPLSQNIKIINPVDQKLNIYNGNSINLKARIINALGQLIQISDVDMGNNSFDVSGFKSGVYFIEVYEKEVKVMSNKIIIN
ncbi:MAG: T9SS type A sorting domain-containing protein [Bacteroidia bacterium]|nr:T9SS type A sorting domain-containing protein [Bacteroidia bacterium]